MLSCTTDLSRFNLLREESEGYAKLLDALLRFERVSANALHVKILVRPEPTLCRPSAMSLQFLFLSLIRS